MDTDNDSLLLLQKLSKRNDFESLHKAYFNWEELSILRINSDSTFGESLWMKICCNKIKSLSDLYQCFISDITEAVSVVIEEKNAYIHTKNVINTINEYLFEGVAELSTRLFISEMKQAQVDEITYMRILSENKEVLTALLKKYPYWGSLLQFFLQDSKRFLSSFLTRLVNDQTEIHRVFLTERAVINNIVLKKGDRHRGEFVVEIETAKGNYFYKPRGAKGDEAFQKCLHKLSESNTILDMKIGDFIHKGEYSWFKKIDYVPLENKNKKDRYYQRMGQLIATIYILNGNDIHHENLISCGEYPVIIDVETILTSRLLFMKKTMPKYTQRKDVFYILDSVRNSMIVPNALKYKEQQVDLSPLQIVSDKHMIELDKKKNHTVYENEISEITEAICRGFTSVYKEIERNKIKYETFFREVFKEVKVRFLNKPTSEYSNIKNLLYNPVCLYDSNFAFAVTCRLYDKDAKETPYEEIIEQKEVLMLNIPYFEVESSSKDLILYNGCRINDYFVESPLDGITAKLEVLGEKDYIRQKKIIEKSFELMSSEFTVRDMCEVERKKINLIDGELKEKIDQFKEQCIKRVFSENLVHPFGGQFFWMDPMLQGDNETGEEMYQLCDIPNSYYAGNVGVFIALLSLSDTEQYETHITKLKQDIDAEIQRLLLYRPDEINIGSYNGLAAYLRYYLCLFRHQRIMREQFRKDINQILALLKKCYPTDRKLDVLDGSAGVILILAELFHILPEESSELLTLMKDLRNHIEEQVIYQDNDAYFPLENRTDLYYSGFAHGSCGIITALNKANLFLGRKDDGLLSKLLHTERKMYDPKRKIWNRDNRKADHSWGWCHGIPGILLSRIELYKDGYTDDRILAEIHELYEISLNKSLGANLTLCHGDLSNIIICKQAGELLGRDNLALNKYVESILPVILDSPNKKIRGTEAIGLMSGIMGVVMFVDNFIQNKNDKELIRVLTGL